MKTEDAATKEAVGQLFMVGLPGLEMDSSTQRLIGEYRIHNFILFKRNVGRPDRLRKLCADLTARCKVEGLPPPLISIDQEGGTVARLSAPFTEFPDARVLAESPEAEELLQNFARISARELLDLGITMNLAPVLDVCPAGEGYFMERRVLGADPGRVSVLARLLIDTMQEHGLAACAKHFPGLGAARLDPHKVLPVVARDRETLRKIDLIPFRAAIEAGVAAIMTSHTIYKDIDPEMPATLSKTVLTGILRRELGYDGLVITDDLEMGAIENDGSVDIAALLALEAGADLLLICHEHDKVVRAFGRLSDAVHRGRLTGARLEESIRRLAAVRQRFAGA